LQIRRNSPPEAFEPRKGAGQLPSHLYKYFGSQCAVENLSLNFSSGEIFDLLGPDGAVRTTTMRLLCSAIIVDGGEIKVAGFEVIK
jgi:ABC-2 type transport system ATP-binding protein